MKYNKDKNLRKYMIWIYDHNDNVIYQHIAYERNLTEARKVERKILSDIKSELSSDCEEQDEYLEK